MVSMDPSDGQGTCHCESCKKLGTTTDRVFHLANAVARQLNRDDPRGWVGLYAYSSHRLSPTIDVEPNVRVQVALGFNRTQFSLPELVERWSKKVSAIGLREYYGVKAWDCRVVLAGDESRITASRFRSTPSATCMAFTPRQTPTGELKHSGSTSPPTCCAAVGALAMPQASDVRVTPHRKSHSFEAVNRTA